MKLKNGKMTAIQSKINELNARIDQFKTCGHFSEETIGKVTAPLLKELEEITKDINVETTGL